ncbi:MAG: serine hydrolase domain-containing protein [Pyrinomonadaceae bacterium]
MKPFKLFLLPILIVAFVVQIAAQDSFDSAAFDKFVQEQMEKDKIPGLSIGYSYKGKTWVKGYGFADIENRSPALAQTMYRMASVNKPMTAAAILLLADRGKLNLDDEVQKYVPYFPKKNFPVTIRQLLSHTGGISHYKNYEVEGRIKEKKTTREAIAIFEEFDLVAEPGTRASYSSYGYNLLGAVIEGASGEPYSKFMTENVWLPLGMNATRMDDAVEIIPFRTRGYQLLEGEIKNSDYVDISSRFAAGGIRSNVLDMLKFGDAIANRKLLSPNSINLMYNPATTKDGKFVAYSAGWNTTPINGHFTISHSGGQPETATHLFVFPKVGIVIAVAANREGAPRVPFASKLFEMVTSEKWKASAPVDDAKKSPREVISQMLFDYGRAAYEKSNGAFTTNAEVVSQAFLAINRVLANKEASPEDIDLLRHPAGNEAIQTAGSFIAAQLSKAGYNLKSYSAENEKFVADYLELSKRKGAQFKQYQLDF